MEFDSYWGLAHNATLLPGDHRSYDELINRWRSPYSRLFAATWRDRTTPGECDIVEITSPQVHDDIVRRRDAREFTRLEWFDQSPDQQRQWLHIMEFNWQQSLARDGTRAQEYLNAIHRELKRLDRIAAGKHPYPWWHWKRWLR